MSNGDNGLSGVPILGPILSILSDIFGSASNDVAQLGQAIGQVEQNVWTDIVGGFGWAFDSLGELLGSLKGILGAIAGALGAIAKAIASHLKQLLQDILNFLKWLHNMILPLIKWLQQLQKAYNAAVGQWMRQMMDIIQRIRKILVPFRLLHLAFANKLDAALAGFESDIGVKWAKLIAFNNQILGILNDVLDPRNLLRPGNALGSLGNMVGAVRGAIGAADVRTLFCMGAAVKPSPLAEPWSTTQARVLNEISTNSGTYAFYAAQRDQVLQSYAIDLGTPPIPTS